VVRLASAWVIQRERDCLEHTVDLIENVWVPEADYLESLAVQPARSVGVLSHHVAVLTAIELDDKFALEADKIHDVLADRRLATEFAPAKSPHSEASPETAFGLREVFAKFARKVVVHGTSLAGSESTDLGL
jgi:hypothetical protein